MRTWTFQNSQTFLNFNFPDKIKENCLEESGEESNKAEKEKIYWTTAKNPCTWLLNLWNRTIASVVKTSCMCTGA